VNIECAIIEFKGSRLVVALPDSSYVRPGVGDDLIKRLQPHYPALPIMLVTGEPGAVPVYAQFQAAAVAILAQLDLASLDLETIDLDLPAYDDTELPF